MQLPVAGIVPPLSCTLVPPPTAVTMPAQVVVALGVAAMAKLAGRLSVTAAPNSAMLLVLASVRVSVTPCPILACAVLNALVMLGGTTISTESLALLFAALAGGSPPPLMLAVLTMVCAVVAVTLAFTVMAAALAPAARTALLAQLMICPETEQVQPVPEADTGVMPAGKVSLTEITAPLLAPAPVFWAVRV